LETAERDWHKSTFSQDAGCVEVKILPDGVLVRDSKARERAVLHFRDKEWQAFLRAVVAGDFGGPPGT
jgi:uncharacterized protein DUF397